MPALQSAMKFLLREKCVNDVAVYPMSQIQIPASKSVVIKARMSGRPKFSTGILETALTLSGGIALPPCAVSMANKNTVFVRLLNLTAHVVHIPKQQKIGIMVHTNFIYHVHCAHVTSKETVVEDRNDRGREGESVIIA